MAEDTKAVIDVGTNSIKLLVARSDRGFMSVVADAVTVCRLGEGTDETGLLSREAMVRSAAVMKEMACEARRLGVADITAVGTQALRGARNRDEFIAMAESACGVKIRVIEGEEEAGLSFRAASSLVDEKSSGGDIIVLDVGGGSSEIVFGGGGTITGRHSVPVGALSLYKKFFETAGAVSGETITNAGRYAASAFRTSGVGNADITAGSPCFGVGGTVAAVASVMRGSVISADEIDRQIALYASVGVESRKKIPGLPPQRADIILPGACIVRELMKIIPLGEIVFCERGLRHGLMAEMLSR